MYFDGMEVFGLANDGVFFWGGGQHVAGTGMHLLLSLLIVVCGWWGSVCSS